MSEISATDRYAFMVEWFDAEASLIKNFYLFFFPFDHTLELFDVKNRRTFLKRTRCEGVTLNELFVGNTIEVFSRQMKITGYADEMTKKKMSFSMQKTFGMIKPDGIKNMGPVLRMLYENGFKVSKLKMVHLTNEEAAKFYSAHSGQSYLPYLIQHISSGPVIAMELVAENAISKLNDLVGPMDPIKAKEEAPYSIRACFGSKNHNVIHSSDDMESVTKESEVIFKNDPAAPNSPKSSARFENSTCCIVKPCAIKDGKLGEIVSLIQENNFEITAMQMFYLDHHSASEFYEIYKGVVSEYPAMVSHLISGPCVAMEIVGPAGVDTPVEFRKLVGPSDPDIARQLRPNTIRAMYGKNKVQNAVHVTDLPEDAILEKTPDEVEVDYGNVSRTKKQKAVQYFFKILNMAQ